MMASIIFGLIVVSYDAVAKYIRRRRVAKAHSTAQLSQLEQENLARIQRLGGNHFDEEEHPDGPYDVGSPVIRNDMDGGGGGGGGIQRYDDGSDTTRPEEEDLPPGYDEVIAETRRRG